MMHRTTAAIWLTWACLGLGANASAGMGRQQIADLFSQANEAFRKANTQGDPAIQQPLYDKAILNCQKIVQDGHVHNAKLYYNLANAYLLKGDIGQAILNYRRAEGLDGGDANIQKNLAFARSRRIDQVPVKTEQQVMRTLLFWHYDLATKTRLLGTHLAMAAVCLSLTVMVWRGRSSPAILAAVIAAILVVCLAGSVSVEVLHKAGKAYGVITAGKVVARQGDGPNYPESFTAPLHAGTEFELIERRPGWLHIRLTDDRDTWINDAVAELI